jgi:hypothetical protein
MEEEFLSYIWGNKLFHQDTSTLSGEYLDVIYPGERNQDSGPDFFNARVKIGKTIWAGNIEIHVKTSDWFIHGHHKDDSYHGLILHVVFENDLKNEKAGLPSVPILELKNRFDTELYRKYRGFLENKLWIPCSRQIRDVDQFTINNWLENLAIGRLEKKSERLTESLKRNKQNWEQTFYEFVARGFGARVNADAFERLARSLPLLILAREKNELFKLEALLFGQAGMLGENFDDEYFQNLKKEYQLLQRKYGLKPIPKSLWKFMRLRPSNFPTLRIAQFAKLIFRSSSLFSRVMEGNSAEELFAMFRIQCDGYWDNHYRFGKASAMRIKKLGEDSVNLILVNTVVPFLFIYGRSRGNQSLCDRALNILDRLAPEENSIIQKWRTCGIAARSAMQTQALLELKESFCNKHRCLDCRIGNLLLKS